MFRPDPRALSATPAAQVASSNFEDSQAWAEDAERDGKVLLRLLGAAAVAILALAAASLLIA